MTRMNRRQALAAMPLLLSTGSLGAAQAKSPVTADSTSIVRYAQRVTYRGRLTCRIDATNAGVDHLEVWLPIPTNWREQRVWDVAIAPVVKPLVAANGTTRVARWHFGASVSREKLELSVSFLWRRAEIVTDVDRLLSQKSLPYDTTVPGYLRYTASESKIPTDAEPILREIRDFAGRDRPAAHIARDIYRWVLDRTTYQVVDWLGATECLAQKTGACGDYSALFVAACRSVGIPARTNIGFWAAERNGTHVWAEFQLPTGEWIPVDPSMDDQGETLGEKYFGWLDSNRLTMTKFSDVRLPRLGRGPGEVDFLQVGAHWVWGQQPPEITHEFVGERLSTTESLDDA